MTTNSGHFQLRLSLSDELTPGLRRAEQNVDQSMRRMAQSQTQAQPRQGRMNTTPGVPPPERAQDALMGRPNAQQRQRGWPPTPSPFRQPRETTPNAIDALMGRPGAQQVETGATADPFWRQRQEGRRIEDRRVASEQEQATREKAVRDKTLAELARFGVELARINQERLKVEQQRAVIERHAVANAKNRVFSYTQRSDDLAAEAMAASAGGGMVPPGDVPRRPAGAGPQFPDQNAWYRQPSPREQGGFLASYFSGDRTAQMREVERQPEMERYLVDRQRIAKQLQAVAENEGGAILDDLREQERLLADMRRSAPDDKTIQGRHVEAQTRVTDFEKVNTGLVRMAKSGELADRYLENTTSKVISLGVASDSDQMLRYADSLHVVGNEYRTIGTRWRDAQRSGMFLTDMTRQMQTGFQGVASTAQGMMLGMSALEGNIIGLTFSLIFLQFAGMGGLALAAGAATLAIGGTIKALQYLIEKRQEERRAEAGLSFETLDPGFRERERANAEAIFREKYLPSLQESEILSPSTLRQLEKDFERGYSNLQARFLLTPELAIIGKQRPDLLFSYEEDAERDLYTRLLRRSTAGEEETEASLRELAAEVAQSVVTKHQTGRGLTPREDDGIFVTSETLRDVVTPIAEEERKRTREFMLGFIPKDWRIDAPAMPLMPFSPQLDIPLDPKQFGYEIINPPSDTIIGSLLDSIRGTSQEQAGGNLYLNVTVTGNNIGGTQDDAESFGDVIARKIGAISGFPTFGIR